MTHATKKNIGSSRWLAGSVATGLLALLVGFPTGKAKTPPRTLHGPRKVQVALAEWSSGHARFRAHGLVRSHDRAALSFTVAGRVAKRFVREGDRVHEGQLLARIDGRAYGHGARIAEASARQAAAELSLHEGDHARLTTLAAERAVSRDQLERIGSALEAARASSDAAHAQLNEAKRSVRETDLRAPFSGVILAVLVERGEYALPGNPAILMSSEGALEVQVEVPGRIARRLAVGSEAQVVFPLDGESPALARVTAIADAPAGTGRLCPVVLELPAGAAPGIHPGSAAEVTLDAQEPRELTVPAAAIVAPSGVDASVFRIRDGKAQPISVELGSVHSSRIGVRGDLQRGDQVVVAGYIGLVSGESVEPLP